MVYPTRNEFYLDNKRNGTRIEHDRMCFLFHNGVSYPCRMQNISLSGTLISALDRVPEVIQPGDMCGIFLTAEPNQCPVEYTSKVVRLEHSKIGLYFLGMTF